jgi:hypothetical protein
MIKHLRNMLLLCSCLEASGQEPTPPRFEQPGYMPVFRAYREDTDKRPAIESPILSPRLFRSVQLIEKSDTTIIPYDQSIAIAVIFEGENPLITFEIPMFRNFEIKWINDDLVHIYTSPGRCVGIDSIYDVSKPVLLYEAEFQFCGL